MGVLPKPTHQDRQLLLSLGIALVILFATAFVVINQTGFDIRSHAAKPKTAGEIKKALRTNSSEEDCSSAGGQWIGKKKGGFCRPKTEDEVKKALNAPLNSPSAAPSAEVTQPPQGNSVQDYIHQHGLPIGGD